MLSKRIIPTLLLSQGAFVKTIKFKKRNYLGDPCNIVSQFNNFSVDEIIILDIDASRLNQKPNFELIKSIASESFIPMAYGGGISSLLDAQKIINSGVEKVVINSNLGNIDLIRQIERKFGRQCIVASIDCYKNFFGKYKACIRKGNKYIYYEIVDYIKKVQNIGVGEIFLQSINNDGMMCGYDLKLIKLSKLHTTVPIIACGGAKCREDFGTVASVGASAAAAGSVFVYSSTNKSVLINYPSIKQREEIIDKTKSLGT